jgi:quercetin dioxygenase-like cupin family protein
MKKFIMMLWLTTGVLTAQQSKATPLMSKELIDIPGKECVMLSVEFAPGSVGSVHRHNAHAFIYVLEGSIVMQVRGGTQVTLEPGQTFYESPDDVHTVSRNASNAKPARFLVFFVKDRRAPMSVPAK